MSIELEERIAHLERMLEELSQVVAGQAEDIARLGRLTEALRRKAVEDAAAAGGGIVFGDERPPHY